MQKVLCLFLIGLVQFLTSPYSVALSLPRDSLKFYPADYMDFLPTRKAIDFMNYINQMLEKYPNGNIKDDQEKTTDRKLCSLYPEIAILWFMVYLSDYLARGEQIQLAAFAETFEKSYRTNYNAYNKIDKAVEHFTYLRIIKDMANHAYLVSYDLRLLLPIHRNKIKFEPLTLEWIEHLVLPPFRSLVFSYPKAQNDPFLLDFVLWCQIVFDKMELPEGINKEIKSFQGRLAGLQISELRDLAVNRLTELTREGGYDDYIDIFRKLAHNLLGAYELIKLGDMKFQENFFTWELLVIAYNRGAITKNDIEEITGHSLRRGKVYHDAEIYQSI